MLERQVTVRHLAPLHEKFIPEDGYPVNPISETPTEDELIAEPDFDPETPFSNYSSSIFIPSTVKPKTKQVVPTYVPPPSPSLVSADDLVLPHPSPSVAQSPDMFDSSFLDIPVIADANSDPPTPVVDNQEVETSEPNRSLISINSPDEFLSASDREFDSDSEEELSTLNQTNVSESSDSEPERTTMTETTVISASTSQNVQPPTNYDALSFPNYSTDAGGFRRSTRTRIRKDPYTPPP